MDKELIMMLVIAIGGIILLVFLANMLRNHRIFRAILMAMILIGIISSVVYYVYTNEMIFSNEANYYVYGKVDFVSTSTGQIKLDSVRTNFTQGGKGSLIIKVSNRTQIIDERNSQKEIKLGDIKYDNTIIVYCSQEYTTSEDNTVNAKKIIVKN